MREKEFLNHLAGLRGLAILLVVLFHMDSAVWAQGYLGVDVFLVITGYLLFRARLAAPGMVGLREAGGFLLKRVQRIVPPMLVIILLTTAVSLVFLWWPDALFCGRLGIAACYAKANMMLKREFEDYFASDSAFIPLLHLWYLSLTLQVYLIYAVANQLLQRLPKVFITVLLALLGAASLLYCYNVPVLGWLNELGLHLGAGKAVSYYQTLPRVWEVMAGGLVCVLPACRKPLCATVYALLGLLLILLPALAGVIPGTSSVAQLPGALMVVAGTVLCLRYIPAARVRQLLDNRALVWLGGISFSLYLVHMPIIVFMRMWVFGEPGVLYSVLMLLVSVAVGVAFWYGVEKRRTSWWVIVPLWGLTFLFCREVRRTEAFRAYLPQSYWETPAYEDWAMCAEKELIHDLDAKRFPLFDGAFRFMNQLSRVPEKPASSLLRMGDDSKPAMCLLIGDSHAAHAYAGLDSTLRQLGISGTYLASYIYPLYGCRKNRKSRVVNEMNLLDWLEVHPQITHVIIAQRWWDRLARRNEVEETSSALRQFAEELMARGRKVVIIGPTPEFGRQAAIFHYDKILNMRNMRADDAESAAAACTREQYLELNRSVLPVLEKMRDDGLCTLIDPLSVLAPGEAFHSFSGRRMLMTDSHHLGAAQSINIMQRLAADLRAALQAPADEQKN